MPIPAGIENLSVTPASNNPAGTENVSEGDDHLRNAYAFIRQSFTAGSDIASASTITPPSTGGSFNLTGVTTVTAIGTTNSWSGRKVRFRHTGAHSFTQSASLVCPGGVSITFANGDISEWAQNPSGGWEICAYIPAVYMSAPSFVPTGTVVPTNGMYLSAANVLGWATNGVSKATLDATGNLTQSFSVNGTLLSQVSNQNVGGSTIAQFQVVSNNGSLSHSITATAAGGTGTSAYSGTNVWNIYCTSNTPMVFGTNNLPRMTIGAGGALAVNAPASGTHTFSPADIVARGVAVCKFKAANTDRATTTVLSNDPDLVYAIPGAGTYKIRAWLLITQVSGTGGSAINLNYSGTFTNASSNYSQVGRVNAVATASGAINYSAVVTTAGYSAGTLGAADWMVLEGSITTTGAGTVGLAWAQNTSNGTTRVGAGSYLEVTLLS